MSNNWDYPSGWTKETQPEREYTYQKRLKKSGQWEYDYTIEVGRRPDGEKVVRQWRMVPRDDLMIAESNGEKVDRHHSRILNIGDDRDRLHLYHEDRIEAADKSEVVHIVEGEKDAETLIAAGYLATTNPGGAGKWNEDFTSVLAGRDVVLWPDNDESGRRHMAEVYASLLGVAQSVKVGELLPFWPDMPDKADVTDFLDDGRWSTDDLDALVQNASVPEWVLALAQPVIRIQGDSYDRQTQEAEAALIRNKAPFYIYGGMPVRPVVSEVPASGQRMTSVARFVPATPEMLRRHMDRAARFYSWDGRSKGFKRIQPPKEIAQALLNSSGDWQLPEISGVITTPTLRPDGTVLSEPGLDSETRLLLVEPPQIDMKGCPTRQDAEAALALLNGLLDEFPFVVMEGETQENNASRAVALSQLITPLGLGAFKIAPMHAVTAPTPGTGKSYLADIASAIAIGRLCPVISAGWSVEELEKRLGACFISGQSIVSIDNVNGELEGDALCQLIERPSADLRILGASQKVSIDCPRMLWTNGNNLSLVSDLLRRSLLCSMDAGLERPELREFKSNPVELVLADRPKYIAAALTIMRSYICAGQPDKARPLGSFEGWSDTVRSALMWLGCVDPCKTTEVARANDGRLSDAAAVFRALAEIDGGDGLLTRDILEKADAMEQTGEMNDRPGDYGWRHTYLALREALLAVAGQRNQINARSLGWWLRRHTGRLVDGVMMQSEKDSKTKQPRWRFTVADSRNTLQDPANPAE